MAEFGAKADFVVNKVLVPVVTTVLAYFVYSLDASVKTVDNQLRAREAIRLETSDDREMRFKIYEAVTTSLSSADAKRQQVAQALVLSMLSSDDALRTGLLEVLRSQAANETLKDAAGAALEESQRFQAQEQNLGATAVNRGDWRTYNVDIFWCAESGDSARQDAARLEMSLRDAGAKGRLRVRVLPRSINASPGYQISGLVIRREESETEEAAALKQVADRAVPGGSFVMTRSRQATPSYLSAFVCQGG